MDQGLEPETKRVSNTCYEYYYVATRAFNLKMHVKSKHEGVIYPYPECVYAATGASHLKKSCLN